MFKSSTAKKLLSILNLFVYPSSYFLLLPRTTIVHQCLLKSSLYLVIVPLVIVLPTYLQTYIYIILIMLQVPLDAYARMEGYSSIVPHTSHLHHLSNFQHPFQDIKFLHVQSTDTFLYNQ